MAFLTGPKSAEGGGARQSDPWDEPPPSRAQVQTATVQGWSRVGDGDWLVGFFQPEGRASAEVTVSIIPKPRSLDPPPNPQQGPGRRSETRWLNHTGRTRGHGPEVLRCLES